MAVPEIPSPLVRENIHLDVILRSRLRRLPCGESVTAVLAITMLIQQLEYHKPVKMHEAEFNLYEFERGTRLCVGCSTAHGIVAGNAVVYPCVPVKLIAAALHVPAVDYVA